MEKATIFNIQKFCVHDGPGIRTTVFFKGCPLNCLWCHNPESQHFQREILYNQEKCTGCGQCLQSCLYQAIRLDGKYIVQEKKKCVLCEACIEHCINNAREVSGKEYSLKEVLNEIERDRPFYEQSGGGVTFSGGEALCQIDFVTELAKLCKKRGISVAIDTCGYVPLRALRRCCHMWIYSYMT
ncbi:hypothetical protein N752_06640 [Desulforamulus aquiferis]|nr:glycyl-radical enzyme activating protein [Desulforamulus aquiferis]RYD05916.1 hypothetical protein N752_06640 [Desulforamulus aquiferis]